MVLKGHVVTVFTVIIVSAIVIDVCKCYDYNFFVKIENEFDQQETVIDAFESPSNSSHLVLITRLDWKIYLIRIDKTAKNDQDKILLRHEIPHSYVDLWHAPRGACMQPNNHDFIYILVRAVIPRYGNYVLKISEKDGSIVTEWRDFEVDIWDLGATIPCDPRPWSISCTETAVYGAGRCEYDDNSKPSFYDKSDAYAFRIDIDPDNGNPSLAWTIYDDSSKGSEEYYSVLGDDETNSVFLSGYTGWALGTENTAGNDGVIIRVDALTGQEIWRQRYPQGTGDVTCSLLWLNPDKSILYMAGETQFAFNKMPRVSDRHALLGAHDAISGSQLFVQNLGGNRNTLVTRVDVDWNQNLVFVLATTSSRLQGVEGNAIPLLMIFEATSMNLLAYRMYFDLQWSKATSVRSFNQEIYLGITHANGLRSQEPTGFTHDTIEFFSSNVRYNCTQCFCDEANPDTKCMQSNNPCLPDSCHQGLCFNSLMNPDSFSCYCPEDLVPNFDEDMDDTCFYELLSSSTSTSMSSSSTSSSIFSLQTTIESSKSGDDMIIYIAAGAGGGAVILIIILIIICCCCRKNQAKKNSNSRISILQALTSPGFDRRQLQLGAWIGEGAFAQVVEASYKGHNVAVKTLKPDTSPKDLQDFEAEISLLNRINIFGGHKNVIRMIGYDVSMDPGVLVLEFMARGSLLSLLRHSAPTRSSGISNSSTASAIFSKPRQIRMLLDCARGLNFLSRHKLVHRDVAARNVLVDRDYICKLTDFGLARDIYTDNIYTSSGVGLLPFKWMALECIQSHVYNTATDVWSYGVLMWEVFTFGTTPYPTVENSELLEYLLAGKRMDQPDCSDEIYNIMKSCWDATPTNRPSFDDIEQNLMKIQNSSKRPSKEVSPVTVAEYADLGINDSDVAPPLMSLNEALASRKNQDSHLPGTVCDDSSNDPYSEFVIAPDRNQLGSDRNSDNVITVIDNPYEEFVSRPDQELIQLEKKMMPAENLNEPSESEHQESSA